MERLREGLYPSTVLIETQAEEKGKVLTLCEYKTNDMVANHIKQWWVETF